jgi:hypothetical protein
MKKKKIIIWIGIALLVSIAALEAFDCHPSFTIGQYQVRWVGVRHMTFASVDGTNTINGRLEKFTVHIFGPITVLLRHD